MPSKCLCERRIPVQKTAVCAWQRILTGRNRRTKLSNSRGFALPFCVFSEEGAPAERDKGFRSTIDKENCGGDQNACSLGVHKRASRIAIVAMAGELASPSTSLSKRLFGQAGNNRFATEMAMRRRNRSARRIHSQTQPMRWRAKRGLRRFPPEHLETA